MKPRYSVTASLAATVLVLLAVSPAAPATAGSQPDKAKLSPATQRLLEENELKRLAREEPAAAIRKLDELRTSEASPAAGMAIAEVAMRAGSEAPPSETAGLFLRAAVETYPDALESTGPSEASELHVRAVEGLIAALQHSAAPLLDETVLEVTGPLAEYELSWLNAAEDWTPATHEIIPASHYQGVKRKIDSRRPGIGVPVVAWRKDGIPEAIVPENGVFPTYLYSYPLTAILELDDDGEALRQARLRLVDPRLHDTHGLGGVDYPLAIDFGAQLAALKQEIDLAFAKSGTLHAGKYLSLTGIYALEPLRDDKIPVVMIHGLMASIKTWVEAFDAVVADPELRRRYQFAVFTYPTGLPFAYSATLLRRALVEALGQPVSGTVAPLHRRTVLIGHSMGGLLTRLQVTDSGEALWYAVFSKSPEEVDLSPEVSRFMREILIFEPLPFVERVVFCSTPHRGSKTAASAIGKIGVGVVKLPDELREAGKDIVAQDPEALTGRAARQRKFPDSVQSMQPKHDLLVALDELPIDERVTYHSIVGDRGKGNSPDSSDGVVPYWSSHLDEAASEKIVPSAHPSHKNPEGVEELVRILHLHLDEQ